MKKYRYTALLTFIISLMMVVSVVFPTVASAEDSMTSSATQETTHQDTAEQLTAQDTADELTKKDTADQLITSSPAFNAEKTVDGVKVKVSADANVFPEGTTMEVKKVTLTTTEKNLISKKQEDDQTAIRQYSFDITMKNKDGEEIEPDTSKGKVKVTFENELVKNFTTNVYHIDDNKKVDKLKLNKSKDSVTGETKGFSTYYLELTVNGEQIITVPTGSTINLTKVLTAQLKLTDSTKITEITEDNKDDFEGNGYGKLVKNSDGDYELTLLKKVKDDVLNSDKSINTEGGATFSVKISGSTSVIKVKLKNASKDTFTDSAAWIKEYDYIKDNVNKTISLLSYKGSDTDLDIPATVKINETVYQIVISGKVYKGTKIESIKFESGVMADESLDSLFYNCQSLKKVDLSNLDTSKTTNMANMFFQCIALTNDGADSYIKFRDTDNSKTKFTTKNVTSMEAMFYWSGITKIDLSLFDFSSIEEMSQMFFYCSNLNEIDLSSLSGAKTKKQHSTYDGLLPWCYNLNKITLGENWHAAEESKYLPLDLTSNWQNTKTLEVYSNEDLSENFTSSMAGTYVKTTLPPSVGANAQYVVDGYNKEDNMWEVHSPSDTFHGYCLNHDRATPSGYFDKVEIDINATESTKKVDSNGRSNYIMDYLDSTNYGYKELAPNMAKALVTLIYFSEYAAEGNDKVYDQNDIWHFTNEYSQTMSSELREKINGHTYDDLIKKAGKEYKLYIYVPSANNKANNQSTKKMQNLLSIEGAVDQPYAGVSVQKVDNTTNKNPVAGATFRVYKATKSADGKYTKNDEKFGNGETYLEFTTSSNGIGSLPRMDSTYGLSVGSYILEEFTAPSGYKKNDTPYTFDVTKDDNQKLIKVGDENGVIVDNVETNYSGGGITLKKVDSTTNRGLANAEFTLYKDTVAESNKVKTYTTDSNGVLTTGSQDLEIGQKYILKETKAPEGYNLKQSNGEPFKKEITLTNNDKNKYLDIGTVQDTAKEGTVTLRAKKVLKNSGELIAGAYTFQLLDSNGNLIDTQTNDKNGDIVFKVIELTASNMPAVDYQIKEVEGSDKNIEYDTHTERVRVEITDNENDNSLTCKANYDSGKEYAVFTNIAKVNFTGKLTVKKTVDGILADSNDKFNFNLYLTADSTDLNARTFNYTLDGKIGSFTFNKVETTDDGKTKYVSQEPFKLKKDSQLEITNLPVGATYEVKEDDYTAEGYTLTSKSGDTGTISTDGAVANFKNTKNVIVPTSADTFTRSPFWIAIALGALVVIYIKKRKKKINDK
ncbi:MULTISPECIES: SpaA isopeptide-forming pilin-related protein [Erysipelotrichales]|uniref:SpaA isopeptide-forming pilin-related protein n=1 Tax=Intestinibaculum porci TaxID=2487118 RepID=UPI002408FBB8|nr:MULTISPECIES: SpaA isopeptide-forming pilin-related protein [Erysipelotrichales]MDD6348641.1 SpaA isopeptide-forming pilin-related protein [Intestinibaculum porci]MDD6595965.1 SpaA isopeptide-forming pilin-related protein [Catenibacterium mitsuokai]